MKQEKNSIFLDSTDLLEITLIWTADILTSQSWILSDEILFFLFKRMV